MPLELENQESYTETDHSSDVADLLAQMESGIDPETLEPVQGKAQKPAEPQETEEDEAEEQEPAEGDDTLEAVSDEDAELGKSLEKIQRNEARAKEAISKEREALELERQQWQRERDAEAAEYQAWKEAKDVARYDPAGLLSALGITDPDDLMAAARQLYSLGAGNDADPNIRRQAARALADRKAADELKSIRQEMAELKQTLAEERQAAQTQRQVEAYMAKVQKAVSAESSPILNTWAQKSPEKVRYRLQEVAATIAEATGETPDPADVVKALEQARRAELEELGIDPSSVAQASIRPEDNTQTGQEKRRAKSLSPAMGTPKQPNKDEPPKTRDEEIDEVRRLMESGAIE